MTDEPTLKQLQSRAAELEISGRSEMDKAQLAEAIADVEQELSRIPSAAEESAAGAEAAAAAPPEPASVEEVGRPHLVDVAEQRAADRAKTMRVIGSPTQED